MRTVSFSDVKRLYKERPQWSHKGDFGKILTIGGCWRYTGAPYFTSMAALYAGADISIVAAPQRAADAIACMSPDLITLPLSGTMLSRKHVNDIMKLDFDVSIIGNGIGLEKETQKAVLEFAKKTKKPAVIDADALRMIGKDSIRENFILTPHESEFHSISKIKFSDSTDMNQRANAAKNFACDFGCTVLLKGHTDIITDGEEIMMNKTGNPYMTKGGSGDILAGICGALLFRTRPLEAAAAAAYISGLAGDEAARAHGSAMKSTDILDEIRFILRRL